MPKLLEQTTRHLGHGALFRAEGNCSVIKKVVPILSILPISIAAFLEGEGGGVTIVACFCPLTSTC